MGGEFYEESEQEGRGGWGVESGKACSGPEEVEGTAAAHLSAESIY